MALTITSFGIPIFRPNKGCLTSESCRKFEQQRLSLVAHGYSMKDSSEDRRIVLKAAVAKHGVPEVVDRLEFLKQAWCGTPMFLDAICEDLQFTLSLR
jgi:hypothetical protein